ncbi:MAG: hypothetical protein ACI8ZN_002197 [Bacteroidia bacterium]|jgi:hypothetical protein
MYIVKAATALRHFLLLVGLLCIVKTGFAQTLKKDTVLEDGRRGRFEIEVVPCPCDSIKHDSIALAFNACFDTNTYILLEPSILDIADSIAISHGVPPELVYEIGMNESRWPNMYDLDYLIKDGDLQIIDRTFNIFYKRLGLTGGKTRYNYLVVGIYYLRRNYDHQGSWRKARYCYGRGFWKPETQWTTLEKHFMGKIDWTKYDE